jgi:hypothetical protein
MLCHLGGRGGGGGEGLKLTVVSFFDSLKLGLGGTTLERGATGSRGGCGAGAGGGAFLSVMARDLLVKK